MTIISITDPGWDWASFYPWFIGPVLAVTAAVIFRVLSRTRRTRAGVKRMESWSFGLYVSAAGALLVCGLFGSMATSFVYEDNLEARMIQALNDNDFPATNVFEMESSRSVSPGYGFVGSDDEGNPVSGVLFHIDGNEWQVIAEKSDK